MARVVQSCAFLDFNVQWCGRAPSCHRGCRAGRFSTSAAPGTAGWSRDRSRGLPPLHSHARLHAPARHVRGSDFRLKGAAEGVPSEQRSSRRCPQCGAARPTPPPPVCGKATQGSAGGPQDVDVGRARPRNQARHGMHMHMHAHAPAATTLHLLLHVGPAVPVTRYPLPADSWRSWPTCWSGGPGSGRLPDSSKALFD